MLDWGNLEYFISCANHGTLSGCAKEMGVNHSTVSRKIEKLEKELAIKLFERRNSGYALTVHGKDLYKEVQKIDFKISALKERFIPNPDLMDGKLVIYKQGEGGKNMTNIITKLRKNFPNLNIHIMNHSDSSELTTEMYDIGFIGTTSPPEDSIATLLGELNMHVYGSKEYLKKVKNVDDFEWVTYKRKDQADTNFVVNAFFQNPNIIISSNSYQDAHAFVSSGNGVTFLTDLDGDNDPRLVPFNKEEYSFKIGFYLIQHELSRSNPIVRAV
ncbi:MAG: LysR family transcriptional regulator, partial [Proteobacteria bacterium]|nr:LysR family transcriptional regulator [Pseudomonadota bacterium]